MSPDYPTPDYCENCVILRHADPSKLQAAAAAHRSGQLLAYLCPEPDLDDPKIMRGWIEAYRSSDDREEFRIARYLNERLWGTESDIRHYEDRNPVWGEDNEVALRFDTLLNPPLAAYQAAALQYGFSIVAYHHSRLGQSCGKYDSRTGLADCYEYGGGEEVPDELLKVMPSISTEITCSTESSD